MTMTGKKTKSAGPRSAARLAAVQALYQLAASEEPNVKTTIAEFTAHRLGAEVDGEQFVDADATLFADVTAGGWERREEWDALITPCLSRDWVIGRLELIVLAIFRAGSYELAARPDVPTAVVINEYLDVAHAFYERTETSFVNGVLDKLARTLRS